MIKSFLLEYIFAIAIAIVLIGASFLLPIKYGHDLIAMLYWPIENLLADRERQRELTILLFGQMTPNFAPITFLLYFLIWPMIIFVPVRCWRWLTLPKRRAAYR
ncbi:hypothetical protein [Hahella sp. CCB-MM4]|uniref:hypothetical protein n=1 Tax=Hahella sp. (strain CCB-MM4) TaxID=1926491 RepID=UPI00113FF204|nr:hypothetical protein [Hahella sp. CCB-MM4]